MAGSEPSRAASPEGRLLLLAGNWLTVGLMTAGTALAFLSAYDIQTDKGAVLAFCMFASALSAGVHSARKRRWAALAACVPAVMALPAREDLRSVLTWLGQEMGLVPVYAAQLWTPEKRSVLPVLLLLCAALAWTLGLLSVRGRLWHAAGALVLLPLLPAIAAGRLPAWGAMLACFTGWGGLVLTSLFSGADPESLGRARLLSLGGMAALVLALVLALPMEGYARPQWATDARTRLIRGMNRQLERFFDAETLEDNFLTRLGLDFTLPSEGTGASPGLAGGDAAVAVFGGTGRREDLLSVGPRRYTGQMVLSVSTNEPDAAGRMYLRGESLGVYTGESWEEAADSLPSGIQPALYPALTASGGTSYVLTVRDSRYRGVHYYPYRLTEGWGLTDEAGRLTLPDGEDWAEGLAMVGAEEYRTGYLPGGPEDGFTPLSGAWRAEEEAYRYGSTGFQDVYLSVPDPLRAVLEPLAEELRREPVAVDSGLPEQFRETAAAAARTALYLDSLAAYDLNVPAMEPGEDFVTRFLEEGRGYCVHFATAGAMLLRMQGVPARYVTGYVANLNAQGRAVVRDSDAHAWVEVYLEGYGWYPVEMTPGYSGGSGADLADAPDGQEPDADSPPDREETPEEAGEEQFPEEPGLEDAPEEDAPEEALPEASGGFRHGRAAAALVLIPGVPAALYALSLLLRRRERALPDTNRSVLSAYRRYRRLSGPGGLEDALLEELARKARFSRHVLTEEERSAAWERLEAFSAGARARLPRWKAALFPLLRGLY